MWNLSESELLLTIAELSVAFAGFASLASILGRRFSRDDPRVDAGRLVNMLTLSLSVTVLALVPLLPMLLEWSSRWVWGSAGAIGIAGFALLGPSVLRRTRQMRQYPGFNPSANVVNHALAVAAFVGFICCVLGIPIAKPFAIYFGSLVAQLISCAILFFHVIASLLEPRAPGEE